jgi:hypothetical protein
MPARRMLALIKGLPDDAAVWRPDRTGWSQQDELAAMQIELHDQATRALVYWLQVVVQSQAPRFRARLPDPMVGPIEHPDRPRRTPPVRRRRRVRMSDLQQHFEKGG